MRALIEAVLSIDISTSPERLPLRLRIFLKVILLAFPRFLITLFQYIADSMGYALTKRRLAGIGRVQMHRIGISRDVSEHGNIRLGYRLGVDAFHPCSQVFQKVAVLDVHILCLLTKENKLPKTIAATEFVALQQF